MIKLKLTNGKKDRVLRGIRFENGEAKIEDNMMGKAKQMNRFWAVNVEQDGRPFGIRHGEIADADADAKKETIPGADPWQGSGQAEKDAE